MTNGETTSDGPARPVWSPSPGVLVIAGTPLGNAGDATDRLRTAIRSVDLVAAEDTRRFRRLARDLGVEIGAPVTSYFDQNEKDRLPQLITALQGGKSVLLVTDAGMPSVSDPGYRLVSAAIDAHLPVTCLPGPSSVTVALALSGLPCDRFCFEGFLPRKPGERQRALAQLATERRTMVFFEAPHRILPMLEAVRDVFGAGRLAAVCRELTKTYEEVRRATLGELVTWAADGVRGEITVVVEGAGDVRREYAADELAALVADEVAKGMSKKDAVVMVATTTGTPKRTVFEAFHARR